MADQNSTPSRDRVVGIDLGTTNSLVAFMQNGVPAVIPGEDGVNLVPSVVAIHGETILIGNAASSTLRDTPGNAVYSAKRLMGRGIDDVREELKLFPFHLAADQKDEEVLRLQWGASSSRRRRSPLWCCSSFAATLNATSARL